MRTPMRSEPLKKRSAEGFTLLEALIAVSVVSIGAMATLGTMVTTSGVDEELGERGTALRAARTAMENVVSYDYQSDFATFISHWSEPLHSTFVVPELRPPSTSSTSNPPAGGVGTITLNATDPDRVAVTIAINWRSRRGDRTLTLPMTVTGVTP